MVVATPMSQYEHADGYFVVSPEVYAKQAVDVIGNHPMTSGCIAHDLQVAFSSLNC